MAAKPGNATLANVSESHPTENATSGRRGP
jgi:hypothetical protein